MLFLDNTTAPRPPSSLLCLLRPLRIGRCGNVSTTPFLAIPFLFGSFFGWLRWAPLVMSRFQRPALGLALWT